MKFGSIGDFTVAASLLCVGMTALVVGFQYPIGTLRSIGPGFYPLLVGTLLSFVALRLVFLALRARAPDVEKVNWRSLLAVSAAMLSFVIVAPRLGFVPATFMLVGISSLAAPPFRPVSVLLLAAGLAAALYGLFGMVLGIPLTAIEI